MKSRISLSLLWSCLLPVILLVLIILLDRYRAPAKIASSPHFWARLGSQAFYTGDTRRAIPLLSLAAAAHDLTPEGWTMLGDAYQDQGDLADALTAWQNAGNSVGVIERRLQVHRQQRNYLSAIKDLQGLVTLQPQDAGSLYQLGLLLAATRPDQAISYLSSVASLSPAYAAPANTLIQRIQAALIASQPAYTLLESGRALADLGEWELAAEAFRGAAALRPDYAEAWAFLGEALQHIDVPEGKTFSSNGLSQLELARQLDPNSLSANLFLVLYWRRQGQWSRALEILDNLITLDPQNPVIQVEMGNTLSENGDPNAALPYYMRATELAPSDPTYWQALAGFSLHSQYQLRQVALPAARQLLLLSPADPAALDLMGQVLLLLQDPLNAERFIQRAIQINPDYAPARLHLAQVYLLRNATTAARQELEMAITLAPSSPEAEYARRLLESGLP